MYLILSLIIFALPRSSYAYLDPGTGTMILQAVGAALAGSIYFSKLYWTKIKSVFSRKKTESISSADDN